MSKLGNWMRRFGYLAALLCLSSLAGEAAAQAKIRLGYMPIAEETPKFVAQERNIFRKHGLDVEMVRFESGPDMGTALLGGSIQVGMIGTPGLINAAVAGRPLVAIVDNGSNTMGDTGLEYYTGIVVLDGSPIKDFGDLKGKRLAVNVLKANSEAQTMMQAGRWNRENPSRQVDLSNDIRMIVLPFGSMPAALEKGIVDAASMVEPFITQLRMKRKVRVVSPVQYALPNWPVSFGIVRRDYGRNNVEVLRKYQAAWMESVRWVRQNPAAAKAIMQKYVGVSPEVARQVTMPNWSEDINTTRKSTEQIMAAMLAAGMIQKEADLGEFILDDLAKLRK